MIDLAMNRTTYIAEQKAKKRRIFGVLPAIYPRELLWAHDIVPVEIWDPKLDIVQAGAHLQPYICSIVKLALELILSDKRTLLDGLLFPHTCDSIQNLATMVRDFIPIGDLPCFFWNQPKEPYTEASRRYYRSQLLALDAMIGDRFGGNHRDRWSEAGEWGRQLYRAMTALYDLRRRRLLDLNNVGFYRLTRQVEFLHPEDFLPLLERTRTFSLRSTRDRRTGIVISGIIPSPIDMLNQLDEQEILVVDDDFLNGHRRFVVEPSANLDPKEALLENYFSLPPCSTKGSSIDKRMVHLLDLVDRGAARGVIFYFVKFCEPELFDLPQIEAALREKGVPTLVIEVEVGHLISAQLATRIQAFAERIRS